MPTTERQARPGARPDYCDVGSVDQFALAGLQAALQELDKRESEYDLHRARAQIQSIHASLKALDQVCVYAPADSDPGMPSLAFAIPGVSSARLAAQLRRRGMLVGSGMHCAPLAHENLGTQATGLVRISVGIGQASFCHLGA